ncbi:hypothetical protein ACTQ49_12915 [Luteococcus sp. Sow4_B9]|uniref:hypothetical protein n=1 Tax=Luteococcus sp. Sow4_B9 TaxID=3438792 RepID=UPI003F97DA46
MTPSGPGADAKMRNQEPLPRNLRYAMAALAGLGVMASFGAASVSLRPREETHDRFIE